MIDLVIFYICIIGLAIIFLWEIYGPKPKHESIDMECLKQVSKSYKELEEINENFNTFQRNADYT